MMKKAYVLAVLGVILCALIFLMHGCGPTLGETKAEAHRRHLRNARINYQEMVGDIDKALLLDKPSKLSDKRIP